MQPRLTLVRINREFRLRGLRARLEKENNWGHIIYVLKAAAVEGGELHRYITSRRVNRYSLETWVELAGQAVEKAQKHEARKVERNMAAPIHQWIEEPVDPLGGAAWVKLEVVRIEDGRREWISVANGPDALARLEQKRAELYGDAWRLSKGAIVPVLEGQAINPPALRLEKAEEPKEASVSLEDAVALAHLIAEDLAEGKLDGEKVRVVQEMVGGRVRQTHGSYKRALIVGRWVIKVDKNRKPGDAYYVGSAAEALLIEDIKKQHAHLAKHFPVSVVVNYFTSVQERVDTNAARHSLQNDLIVDVAREANIGDTHHENVGWREDDPTTPVFFDVARENYAGGSKYHQKYNGLFMAEYQMEEARRSLQQYEAERALLERELVERTQQFKQLQLNAGA